MTTCAMAFTRNAKQTIKPEAPCVEPGKREPNANLKFSPREDGVQ
jgi:hypothetical protein